jgi:hypothetical protein
VGLRSSRADLRGAMPSSHARPSRLFALISLTAASQREEPVANACFLAARLNESRSQSAAVGLGLRSTLCRQPNAETSVCKAVARAGEPKTHKSRRRW